MSFKKSVFEPKTIYKNNKYCEWINYNIELKEFRSSKCFEAGNKIKRRRKESEFASRQWSKNNGLSSLSLSKSFAYESLRKENEETDELNPFYNNIFQTDEREKANNEIDLDEEYENVSIPFECSIPHRDLEAFLKETHSKEGDGLSTLDLKGFDTFSPNTKEGTKQISNQKDINTRLLNRPPTTANKSGKKNEESDINLNNCFSFPLNNTSECNFQATERSHDLMNKPKHDTIKATEESFNKSDSRLLIELQKYKNLAEKYKTRNKELEEEIEG